MKFGVREICDVVLKAKAAQKVGNKVFYKNEPVIYFDTLKTSSMEGTATTSYAQGGRGNSRLIAWEGERTVTFTMEDALISPAGFMILSGAGLVEATAKNTLKVHTTEQTNKVFVEGNEVNIVLSQRPYVGKMKDGVLVGAHEDLIYVMKLDNGEVATEPYIPNHNTVTAVIFNEENDAYEPAPDGTKDEDADGFMITLLNGATGTRPERATGFDELENVFANEDVVLVDYYVEHASAAQQIEITPDKFGGNYYLEASTLFRDTNGT